MRGLTPRTNITFWLQSNSMPCRLSKLGIISGNLVKNKFGCLLKLIFHTVKDTKSRFQYLSIYLQQEVPFLYNINYVQYVPTILQVRVRCVLFCVPSSTDWIFCFQSMVKSGSGLTCELFPLSIKGYCLTIAIVTTKGFVTKRGQRLLLTVDIDFAN